MSRNAGGEGSSGNVADGEDEEGYTSPEVIDTIVEINTPEWTTPSHSVPPIIVTYKSVVPDMHVLLWEMADIDFGVYRIKWSAFIK